MGLILLGFLVLGSVLPVVLVSAQVENVVNGGLESGSGHWTDVNGNPLQGGSITADEHHGGTHSLYLDYSSLAKNVLDNAVASVNVTGYTAWVKVVQYQGSAPYPVGFLIYYSNGSSVSFSLSFSYDTWTQVNLLSHVKSGNIVATGFHNTQDDWNKVYVDDLSLTTADPTPPDLPVSLYLTCNPSSLGTTIYVDGSPYRTPAVVTLGWGIFNITARGTVGTYTFSKWQVNGTDGSSSNSFNLDIQGNTSVRSFYVDLAGAVFPNPPSSNAFHLDDVDLGTLSPGESRTFNMTFTFTDWMLVLQSIRFTGPSTGFTVSWFVVNDALPKTYFNTFFGSIVGANQIVLTVTAPSDAAPGTTGSFYATASTGSGLSSTATISYKIQGTSVLDRLTNLKNGLGDIGKAAGEAIKTLVRLLGNPWILLILILLIVAIAYYSLKDNKHSKSHRRR